MRQSDEFKDFYSLIHAIDVLDAKDNRIIVWASTNIESHQVEFTAFGKARLVKMELLECDKVVLRLYDNAMSSKLAEWVLVNDEDIGCDTHAKKIINFLVTGEYQC